MQIFSNIRTGKYNQKNPYPQQPKEPELFHKKVSDLTQDDIASLKQLHIDYESKMAQYEEAKKRYNDDESTLANLFWADLIAEYDLDANHPLTGWLTNKAYERGHSVGYSEMANVFVDLADIIEVINKHYTPKGI